MFEITASIEHQIMYCTNIKPIKSMIEWTSKNEFKIKNIEFIIDLAKQVSKEGRPRNQFCIMKSRKRIEVYQNMAREIFPVGNVLELGFSEGGSLVFFDKLFEPLRIIGIDISNVKDNSLEDYMVENEHLKAFYNVAQTDRSKLDKILKREFNDKIDVVIDDASHWYEPTKNSFKYLFPKLSPGGKYVVETWNWSFKSNHQDKNHSWYKKDSLVNVLFELVEDIAINNAIEKIEINQEMAIIYKSEHKTTQKVFVKKARRGRSPELL
jgi:hypothetical protein